jgi:SAM-dependent methyltransferase
MSDFQPPSNWDPIYAGTNEYVFGTEPSQIAHTAFRFFQAFGGDPKTARALDLGSGEGRDTAFLAQAGMHVDAREISPVGLEKTRTLLARRGVPLERVALTLGDVQVFEYPAETYDLALAANVYQFLPPAEAPDHIKRLKSTVKPGGICAVGVFSPAMAGWGVDIARYWTATADDLMSFFPKEDGWLLLDRTDYWTYRPADDLMASFAYVIAQKARE